MLLGAGALSGSGRMDLALAVAAAVAATHMVPGLNLKWLLLDFGRRGATMDAAQ